VLRGYAHGPGENRCRQEVHGDGHWTGTAGGQDPGQDVAPGQRQGETGSEQFEAAENREVGRQPPGRGRRSRRHRRYSPQVQQRVRPGTPRDVPRWPAHRVGDPHRPPFVYLARKRRLAGPAPSDSSVTATVPAPVTPCGTTSIAAAEIKDASEPWRTVLERLKTGRSDVDLRVRSGGTTGHMTTVDADRRWQLPRGI
jgi:hypothetical protein